MDIPLPKSIKVSCYTFTVKEWGHHSASASRRYGEFSNIEQCIRVDTSFSPIKVLDTLIHEINHAIFWAYNICDEDKEERLCGTMSTAWTQIYQDNPDLLDFIELCITQDRKDNANT